VAGAQERTLRRRIRSIQSTRKTTRAMELIASSRIPRAQARIAAARPYTDRLEQLAADLAAAPGLRDHPLLSEPAPGAPTAVIVVAGDRGLSGPYNSSALRAAESAVGDLGRSSVQLLAVGRRAQMYFRFRGQELAHLWTGVADRPTYEDARQVAAPIIAGLADGSLTRVEIVSTRYQSMATQRVERRLLVPLGPELAEAGRPFDYELEPERDEMLDLLAPQLLQARILMALLEASAAEYVARQRAMKAATDNADELVTSLRRVMNRARQDAITTEIMDIVGGAEALRASGPSDLPILGVDELDAATSRVPEGVSVPPDRPGPVSTSRSEP
jgi:F-type H+-transporting ATPase subunit gamma